MRLVSHVLDHILDHMLNHMLDYVLDYLIIDFVIMALQFNQGKSLKFCTKEQSREIKRQKRTCL